MPDERAHTLHLERAVYALFAAAVVCEFMIGGLTSKNAISFWTAVLLHGCVVGLVGAWLARSQTASPPPRQQVVALFAWLLLAVSGPAGALAIVLALPFAARPNAGPEILRSWYRRLAGAGGVEVSTHLHSQIMAGRAKRFDVGLPHDFEDVIANGSLVERQAVLGLIARKFHVDYAPALQLALRSEEPVVRVQAAAVVARVRATLKQDIKTLLDRASADAAGASFADAVNLRDLAACSLVDRTDASLCQAAAGRVLQSKLSAGFKGDTVGELLKDKNAGLTVERFLIAHDKFKEFRVARRLLTLGKNARYKVRLLRQERA